MRDKFESNKARAEVEKQLVNISQEIVYVQKTKKELEDEVRTMTNQPQDDSTSESSETKKRRLRLLIKGIKSKEELITRLEETRSLLESADKLASAVSGNKPKAAEGSKPRQNPAGSVYRKVRDLLSTAPPTPSELPNYDDIKLPHDENLASLSKHEIAGDDSSDTPAPFTEKAPSFDEVRIFSNPDLASFKKSEILIEDEKVGSPDPDLPKADDEVNPEPEILPEEEIEEGKINLEPQEEKVKRDAATNKSRSNWFPETLKKLPPIFSKISLFGRITKKEEAHPILDKDIPKDEFTLIDDSAGPIKLPDPSPKVEKESDDDWIEINTPALLLQSGKGQIRVFDTKDKKIHSMSLARENLAIREGKSNILEIVYRALHREDAKFKEKFVIHGNAEVLRETVKAIYAVDPDYNGEIYGQRSKDSKPILIAKSKEQLEKLGTIKNLSERDKASYKKDLERLKSNLIEEESGSESDLDDEIGSGPGVSL